jgi:DNA polymerase-1
VPLAHRQGGDGAGANGGNGSLFAGEIAPDQISEQDALAAMRPLLEDAGVLKIGQDLKFDLQMFALRGITLAPYDDVMLLSYVLDAGRSGHGIDTLSQRYLGHTTIDATALKGSGKSRITFDHVPMSKAAECAAEVTDMALRLWLLLRPRVTAEHVTTVYETLERPLVEVLASMERRGISIDRQVLSRLSGEFAQRAGALEAEIQKLAGEPLNPGSPKQLGDILFGKFKLPGGTKTKTGAWSTGARALEELAEQGHALPQKILDWRQVSKPFDLYRCCRATSSDDTIACTRATHSLRPRPAPPPRPNLQNIPVRTEEGRRIRRLRGGPGTTRVRRLFADRAAALAEIANIKQLKRRSATVSTFTHDGVGDVRRAGQRHAGQCVVAPRRSTSGSSMAFRRSGCGAARHAREERAPTQKYFERFPGIRDYMEETKTFAKRLRARFGRSATIPTFAPPTTRSAPSTSAPRSMHGCKAPRPTSSAAP